jgi:hypothetical protein
MTPSHGIYRVTFYKTGTVRTKVALPSMISQPQKRCSHGPIQKCALSLGLSSRFPPLLCSHQVSVVSFWSWFGGWGVWNGCWCRDRRARVGEKGWIGIWGVDDVLAGRDFVFSVFSCVEMNCVLTMPVQNTKSTLDKDGSSSCSLLPLLQEQAIPQV